MGLDMFLESSKNDDVKPVHYWRKAYVIMDWFENQLGGVENLKSYVIRKDDIVKLKSFCEKLIDCGNLNDMGDIKPIWFTSREMENWSYHMDTVKSTKKVLDEIDLDEYDYFIFHTWW